MKNEDLLPPIIKDLIVQLGNENIPLHTRDQYCARLENIIECCTGHVEKFRRKLVRHNTIKAKQKA